MTTFSTATSGIGIGASSRSSISWSSRTPAPAGRHRLQRRQERGQRHDARQQQVAVAVAHVVQLAEHLGEHEQHEQRLDRDLHQEHPELAAGHEHVAPQDRQKHRS
jgi:hypothetical protein